MFQQEALVPQMERLRKFALRLARNPSDAEDLVQSTMLRALEKKAHFQDGTNLFSWTSTILFNLFVTGYRHKRKFETSANPEPYIDGAGRGPTQEAAVDLVTVGEYMKSMTPEHRRILFLVCVHEYSYQQASSILGVPVGTVRSRLSRARKQLQQLLAPPASRAPSCEKGNFNSAPAASSILNFATRDRRRRDENASVSKSGGPRAAPALKSPDAASAQSFGRQGHKRTGT